jgi:hypothetical protein
VSTLGIILGKLASALAFVFVLILASIPLTAVGFVFGGGGPEDILPADVVLFVLAPRLRAVRVLLSRPTRRTQSATVLTYLVVLVLTVGTGFTWFFWNQMTGSQQAAQPVRDFSSDVKGSDTLVVVEQTATGDHRPPEALLWLNPVVAAADVVCGMDVNAYSFACQIIGAVTGNVPGNGNGGVMPPGIEKVQPVVNLGSGVAPPAGGVVGVAGGVVVVGDATVAAQDPFAASSTRDGFWPRSALAWVIMSVVLVLASVQLVSPTRRWRVFRRRPRAEAPG